MEITVRFFNDAKSKSVVRQTLLRQVYDQVHAEGQ
jgi:hypothetical protein